MTFTLCYLTSGGMELPSLGQAVISVRKKGLDIDVKARTSAQLNHQKVASQTIELALSSKCIIINLHGGKDSCPIFNQLIEAISKIPATKRPYLHIEPTSGDEDSLEAARLHSPEYGSKTWHTIHSYLLYGGIENFENLLGFLASNSGPCCLAYSPPGPVPTEGIYHPKISNIPRIEEYLSSRVKRGRPTLGLWFYQTYWLNRNLDFIDELILGIEARGANVIPVFHQRFKDKDLGNKGADHVVRHYFKSGKDSRIDALVSPIFFSLKMAGDLYQGLLEELDVPVLQALVSLGTYESWKGSANGLTTMDVSYNAAQPEMDGNLITVPVATREVKGTDPVTGAQIVKYLPIKERIDKFIDLALNWARLRRKENSQKRVAIIFHNYPPRDDRIGCAAGLDSFASVTTMLQAMKGDGYKIDQPIDDPDTLTKRLLSGVTPDSRISSPEGMYERAEIIWSGGEYRDRFYNLPDRVKDRLMESWGEPPGKHMVHQRRFMFPGFLNGNIFITIQPSRGNIEKAQQQYHDPHLPPPHSYLAQYQWIRDVFQADAVIHVGKHGSLEWLPGKALGLSKECYPDIAIQDIPNIYPYIINDPSEGTQAKRRSYACIIDHLTPVYTNADLYDELARLDNLLTEYSDATREDPDKARPLQSMIWDAVEKANLNEDLKVTRSQVMDDFDGFLQNLHSYLHELSDTMINDGLHTLGHPPRDKKLIEFMVQLTRVENGSIPSLRALCAKELGHDIMELYRNPGSLADASQGLTGRDIIRMSHQRALSIVTAMARQGFAPTCIKGVAMQYLPTVSDQAERVLGYMVNTLAPAIWKTCQEIDYCLKALSGRFVPPGPSGSPTRGQADILPTGRNFYSVDPLKIPTKAAWERGKAMGDILIQHYVQEHGSFPSTVGIVVYGGPTMRTRGEDVAEILWLMGVRPTWHSSSGRITGLEVIPLEELKRPRLDVVPRVSGFFRDAFPNLMDLMDRAARMVAALEESPSDNILRNNALGDFQHYKAQGMDTTQAWRLATVRVFGCPPGTYGAGVAEMVEAKQWKTRDDLADIYVHYSAHAYGQGLSGEKKTEVFKRLLSRMELTVKNEDSREYDMMSCTDYFNYYGGLIAAAEKALGRPPASYMGDSSVPDMPRVRTTSQEAMHILRARLVNPKWLRGMMRHGYKGAGDISHMMDVVFGWDATANIIEDWMYEKIAQSYCFNQDIKNWMKKVNPDALHNITDKLLEAISRGMWNTTQETRHRLMTLYLEMEGEMEERKS